MKNQWLLYGIIIVLIPAIVEAGSINQLVPSPEPGDSSTNSHHPIFTFILPSVLVSYGMMSMENQVVSQIDHHFNHEIMEGKKHFSAPVENGLQYSPAAMVYALEAFGIKGRSKLIDQTNLYLMANTLSKLSASFGKDHFHKTRPAGDPRSFPSAHTATAFTAAEFMHQEYKDQSPLLGYAGYPLAALTGALRLTHNKHWFSDVVGGAGVGILSTKISYAAYPWLKEKLFHTKSHATILPYRANGTVGIMFQSSLQ